MACAMGATLTGAQKLPNKNNFSDLVLLQPIFCAPYNL